MTRAATRRRFMTRSTIRMMPEGPEVRSLVESMQQQLGSSGQCVLTGAQLLSGRYSTKGPPVGWDHLQQHLPVPLSGVHVKGKFIWFDCTHFYLFSTLGLSGDWRVVPGGDGANDPPYARVALLFRRHDAAVRLVFTDTIGYGTLKLVLTKQELDKKLKQLGRDWIDDPPSFLEFFDALGEEKPTKPLTKFLIEQKRFSGIGNYIISEILYRARVSPFASCGALREHEPSCRDIYGAIVDVITSSYLSQTPRRQQEGHTFTFQVYRQQVCSQTGETIVKETGPHGRSVFWVPSLQTRCVPPPTITTTASESQ